MRPICRTCDGEGTIEDVDRDRPVASCGNCRGTGLEPFDRTPLGPEIVVCPKCRGTRIERDPEGVEYVCGGMDGCGGRGWIRVPPSVRKE